MAIIRLIHWDGPEGRERRLRLASLGHQVEFDDLDGPGLTWSGLAFKRRK